MQEKSAIVVSLKEEDQLSLYPNISCSKRDMTGIALENGDL